MLLFKLKLCNDGDGLVVFSAFKMRPCQHNLGKLGSRFSLLDLVVCSYLFFFFYLFLSCIHIGWISKLNGCQKLTLNWLDEVWIQAILHADMIWIVHAVVGRAAGTCIVDGLNQIDLCQDGLLQDCIGQRRWYQIIHA